MKKTIEFIENLVKEIGIENAREEYINSSMEDLDNFAKDKGFDEVFHLTFGEYIPDTEIDEIDDTRKFIQYYRSQTNGELRELFDILLDDMRVNQNLLPAEILGKFFDKITKNYLRKGLTFKEFLANYEIEELKVYFKSLDIVIRELAVDEEERLTFAEEEQKYILRIWVGEGGYLYFKFTKDEIYTKIDRVEESEYFDAESFRDYNYIFKIGDLELFFQIKEDD